MEYQSSARQGDPPTTLWQSQVFGSNHSGERYTPSRERQGVAKYYGNAQSFFSPKPAAGASIGDTLPSSGGSAAGASASNATPTEELRGNESQKRESKRDSACSHHDLELLSALRNVSCPQRSITFGSGGKELHMVEAPANGVREDIPIININLYMVDERLENVRRYYKMCSELCNLHVTTSCFSLWRGNKKINAFAKVIPAVPSDVALNGLSKVRVFFFDDNLEWGGTEDSPGICNLRNIETGDFVDFTEERNGFQKARAGCHTTIHHSDQYQCVLVKANILDAISDHEYFEGIIRRFRKGGEKILIFMDVNSTIVCNDTVQSKDLASTLRGTMFEFIEFEAATKPWTLDWRGRPPLRLEKTKVLKTLVKDITSTDRQAYTDFWSKEQCDAFFKHLSEFGTLRWMGHKTELTLEDFYIMFEDYYVALQNDIDEHGIVNSWYNMYERVRADHVVVLNSFGVDTRKVLKATMQDEAHAMQITVNFSLWEERDQTKFESQWELPKA